MATLIWCLKQKKGIELIEPNDNLSNAYFMDADDSLLAMDRNVGKWRIVTAYYSCYNALYALLMKTGIKSEIHDCSLALMSLFSFTAEEVLFMSKLKKDRIDVQYYLKAVENLEAKNVKVFLTKCKILASSLDNDSREKIRSLVKNGRY